MCKLKLLAAEDGYCTIYKPSSPNAGIVWRAGFTRFRDWNS